jgi:DNA-directed RNA polymerase subunit RPC12/RpoP
VLSSRKRSGRTWAEWKRLPRETGPISGAIRAHLIPEPGGEVVYRCLGCHAEHGIESLLYTCPDCGQVLLLHDRRFDRLKAIDGETWQQIFDYRRMLKIPAVKGHLSIP